MLKNGGGVSTSGSSGFSQREAQDTANVYRIVRAMHSHGHLNADIDPLRLREHYAEDKTLQ
jgi:2-oxoglutarate dehydrogenase complex dehydrogenase (E1) component-like enzyme